MGGRICCTTCRNAAQRQLEQMGEQPVYRFWRGVAVALQGGFTEAMRDFTAADDKRDVSIAVIAAKYILSKANAR